METQTSVKGQIVIPAPVRKRLSIKAGTRFRVEIDEETGRIILTPITAAFVENLRGRFRGKKLLKALAAEKEREKSR